MREAQASSRVVMLSKHRRSLNCYTMAQRGLWKFGGAIHRSVDARLDAMAAEEHGPLVAAEPSPKRPRLLQEIEPRNASRVMPLQKRMNGTST